MTQNFNNNRSGGQADSKQVEILVRTMRPDNRYSYDLFDEYGNLILKAHKPMPDSLIKHLLSNNIEYLYYDPSKTVKDKTKTENDAGLNTDKNIIDDDLKEEVFRHTKDILEHARNIYSKGELMSKAKIDRSRQLVEKMIENMDGNSDGIFTAVIKLKNHDEYYYQHSTQVSILSALMALRLDFKEEVRAAMGVGALFHDIGMSSISKDILRKAMLSDEEFDIVKNHPHVAYKTVENNAYFQDLEKRLILLHHERGDGQGYPFSFELDHYQDQVPKEIRLFSLCDVYISLVLTKPGIDPIPGRNALRKMLNMVYAPYKKEYAFLPGDFRDFIRSLGFIVNRGNFFINRGDLVRLNSGEVAIIEEMNKLYPMNPKIRILKNSKLETLKRPIQIDMLKDYKTYIANVFERSKKKEQSLQK